MKKFFETIGLISFAAGAMVLLYVLVFLGAVING